MKDHERQGINKLSFMSVMRMLIAKAPEYRLFANSVLTESRSWPGRRLVGKIIIRGCGLNEPSCARAFRDLAPTV
jgi:hypothetical protein